MHRTNVLSARSRGLITSAIFGIGATALGGVALLSAYRMSLAPWLPILLGAAVLLIAVSLPASPYRLVWACLFALIALNLAVYSFLQQLEGGAAVAVMRLPILLAGLLLCLRKTRVPFARLLRRHWDFLLVGVAGMVTGIFAIRPVTGFVYGAWTALSLMLVVVFAELVVEDKPQQERRLSAVANLLFWGYAPSVLLAVVALPGYVPGTVLVPRFSSSNFHAYATPVVLASLLILLPHARGTVGRWGGGLTRVVAWTLVPLSVAVTVLSGKRSALITIGLMILIYMLSGWPKRAGVGRRIGRVAVSLAGLGIFVYAISVTDIVQRRIERARSSAEYFGDRSRYEIYRANIEVWRQHPVVGVGLTNAKVATRDADGAYAGYAPHSTYLAMLSETGLLGLTLFLLVAARSIAAYVRIVDPSTRRGILILAVAPLLISLTEYNLTPGQSLYWPFWLSFMLPRMFQSIR